jgi:hypothetical protein
MEQNEFNSGFDRLEYHLRNCSLCIIRLIWVDNIRTDHGKIVWGGVNWVGMAQDKDKRRALVNAVMNLRVP